MPAPDGNLSTGVAFVTPRNETEQALAEIWQALLKAERVGVHDNFFDLGGDSIKAIQMMSRLHARGLKLEMRQLFQFPTLGEAAQQITAAVTSASQETVEGEVELTPVQRWFFEASFTEAHHWNQSVMLHSDSGFDERIVRDVWTKLTGHHDALRTVYQSEAEGVRGWNRGLQVEGFTLTVMDLTEESDPTPCVEEEATRVQSSLNLSEGPLVGLGLFRTADGDHLLIAIHHLVVDGVSWRILLEDFAQGYTQAEQGEAIMLPEKTTSYQAWSQGLQEYAQSKGLSREREYWSRMEELPLQPLPKDGIVNERLVGEMTSVSVELTEEETTRLVKEAPRAYRTEINDMLLTALGKALGEWSGTRQVAVELEGHGREDIVEGMDVSRTVGWFTTMYPVVLELDEEQELGDQLIGVKEQLRSIPNKGIGYGVLKYLAGSMDSTDPAGTEGEAEGIMSSLSPQVSFNYLGEFGEETTGSWGMSSLSGGAELSAKSVSRYALDINGGLTEGKLSFNWSYHPDEYQEGTIRALADAFANHLRELSAHCAAKTESEWTPSDYGYGSCL